MIKKPYYPNLYNNTLPPNSINKKENWAYYNFNFFTVFISTLVL